MTLEYVIRTLVVNKIPYIVKNYKQGRIFVEPNHNIFVDISEDEIFMTTTIVPDFEEELGWYSMNELIALLKGNG